MGKLKTGWYKHANNQYPKWKAFINIEEKNYFGFGVDGTKMKMMLDFKQMKHYIKNGCVPFNPDAE